MQDAKEEVRARLAIEDIIGEYVQLKRAGRNFKGLSPFSSEKTPSFVVSPEKQIWHDFSSGRGGDVFSFLMEVEGLDFRQALEQLARKAGVELAEYDNKKAGEIAKKKRRLLDANELAARYYQQCLVKNKHALRYVFETRKLTKETVQEFRIGYAPDDGDALVAALKKRGFTAKELSDAGLTNRYGSDLFRGRMMVSLMDPNGEVIGFTGRVLQDEPNAPKYLNTPATLIYDKSRHVFGLHQAKEAIRKNNGSVLVEGNMDVVSSHQAGVEQVVATAGTALTEYQLKSLVRLSAHVKLAFDGDKAGIAATERALPIAQTVGAELSIVQLPAGVKDPDELIQQDVSLWQKAIEHTTPAIEWVIQQYTQREDMSTATGKRTMTTESFRVLRSIRDEVEVEHYLKLIAKYTDSSLEAIRSKFENGTIANAQRPLKEVHIDSQQQSETFNGYIDNLLAVLAITPNARNILQQIDIDLLDGKARQELTQFMKSSEKALEPLPKTLQEIETYVKIVELKAETRYAGWTEQDKSLEATRLLRRISTEQKKQEKANLLEKLRDAETAGDEKSATALRMQLHEIIKETSHG